MSQYKHKADSGTLFVNKFKKNDNHPDYIGTYAMPDGTIREVAGWLNTGKDSNYISLKFSNAYESQRSA